MKQKERHQLSKEKILEAALQEFGTKNYEQASLNALCSCSHISKGLIYHYFQNKEELYLACIQMCFDKLTGFIAAEVYDFSDFHKGLSQYLKRRYRFFHEHPQYCFLFFSSMVQPPSHLTVQIKSRREKFDQQSSTYYQNALRQVALREHITTEDALEYFMIFQDTFHNYFMQMASENTDFHSLMKTHEMKLSIMLDMMLYGIAKEGTPS